MVLKRNIKVAAKCVAFVVAIGTLTSPAWSSASPFTDSWNALQLDFSASTTQSAPQQTSSDNKDTKDAQPAPPATPTKPNPPVPVTPVKQAQSANQPAPPAQPAQAPAAAAVSPSVPSSAPSASPSTSPAPVAKTNRQRGVPLVQAPPQTNSNAYPWSGLAPKTSRQFYGIALLTAALGGLCLLVSWRPKLRERLLTGAAAR